MISGSRSYLKRRCVSWNGAGWLRIRCRRLSRCQAGTVLTPQSRSETGESCLTVVIMRHRRILQTINNRFTADWVITATNWAHHLALELCGMACTPAYVEQQQVNEASGHFVCIVGLFLFYLPAHPQPFTFLLVTFAGLPLVQLFTDIQFRSVWRCFIKNRWSLLWAWEIAEYHPVHVLFSVSAHVCDLLLSQQPGSR